MVLLVFLMPRDNRDRYGYRHRSDPDYGVGESKPGDVGDSEETYHDRARKNSNVIVNGEVRSKESHKRSSVETSSESASNPSSNRNVDGSISQSKAVGKVVELTVENWGGTHDTMAHYKNHQVHIEGGTPGETIRVKLERGSGYLVGRRVQVRE